MLANRQSPAWLYAISFSMLGAALVFLNFAGALPLIQDAWQLSNAEAGLIQSAGQIGYLVAVLLLASLSDYVPPERLIVAGALFSGAGNILFALLAHDVTSAVLLRIVTGLGVAGIYMPGVNLIAQRIPLAERGRAMGIFVSAFTFGSGLSIALGGTLASLLGWQISFATLGVIALCGALITLRYAPASRPRRAARTTAAPILPELRHNQPLQLSILTYVGHTWEVLGVRSWLPAFLAAVAAAGGASLGGATLVGANLAGLTTMIGALGLAVAGRWSDSFGRMRVLLIIAAGAALGVSLIGFTLSAGWAVTITVVVIATTLTTSDSAIISTTLTAHTPPPMLGRVLAIYSFLGFSAGALSPLLVGAALDFTNSSWAVAFIVCGCGGLFASIAATRLKSHND